MRNILTRLTLALGEKMAENETNELYESKKSDWKYDVVIQFITLNINNTDTLDKAVELSKNLGLEHTDSKYWKDVISTLKTDFNKDKIKREAAREIKSSVSSYGCGLSSGYGCGSSSRSRSSYGCGSSSRSSYGC